MDAVHAIDLGHEGRVFVPETAAGGTAGFREPLLPVTA